MVKRSNNVWQENFHFIKEKLCIIFCWLFYGCRAKHMTYNTLQNLVEKRDKNTINNWCNKFTMHKKAE